MKKIINKLIHGITALLLLLSHAKGRAAESSAGRMPGLLKKEMAAHLTGKVSFPYPGAARDKKLLGKRLRDYQRSVWKGSHAEKEWAAKRLQKQWRKVKRNENRSLHVIYKGRGMRY